MNDGNQQWAFFHICHDASSNALGRTLSTALVTENLGDTTVIALGRAEIWPGTSQFDVKVKRISGGWKSKMRAQLDRALSEGKRPVVFFTKGLRPLPAIAVWFRRKYPRAILVLDIDDDDVSLAREYRAASTWARLTLHALRRGHPRALMRAQCRISRVVDYHSFSSNALRLHAWPEVSNYIVLPHARIAADVKSKRPRPFTELRVGFFGTVRPHKGVQYLESVLDCDASLRLYVFRGQAKHFDVRLQNRVIEVPNGTTIEDAYGVVDCAIFAMDFDRSGSLYQLPAKLVDALNHGVHVAASPTPAISEFLDEGDVVFIVGQARNTIERLRKHFECRSAGQIHKVFIDHFSTDLLAKRLRDSLSRVG